MAVSREAARDRVTDALGRVDIAAIPVSVQGLGIFLDLLVWAELRDLFRHSR
jgi:hypothetical protein